MDLDPLLSLLPKELVFIVVVGAITSCYIYGCKGRYYTEIMEKFGTLNKICLHNLFINYFVRNEAFKYYRNNVSDIRFILFGNGILKTNAVGIYRRGTMMEN